MRNAGRSAGRVARGRYGSKAAESSVAQLWSVLYAGAIAGDAIVVGASAIVLFDVATTPAYGSVTVYGEVRVSRALTTELKADKVLIDGAGATYWAGDLADPYPYNAGISHTITLTGARSLEPAGNLSNGATASLSFNKAVTTMNGGDWCMVAAIPAVTIVKLAATANAGATSLTLSQAVNWKAGDQIHLPSTDFFVAWPPSNIGNVALDHRRDEIVTVTADVNNSTTVPVSALTYRHHGQLMYVVPPANAASHSTVPNLSYTPRTNLAADDFGTSAGGTYLGQRVLDSAAAGASPVIDNRCTVGHLTRPICIEGSTGTDWTTDGYGGSTMVMDLASKQRLQGVAFNRVGKAGQRGAYPIHHHMRSFGAFGAGNSGTYLGQCDATYNFTRGCVVLNSSNRGHTFHGTDGVELSNSIFVNTDTHAIFLEDGAERYNIIDGNLVSKVNQIGFGKAPIKLHDVVTQTANTSFGPAGIWYTNPKNYLRNNIIMGAWIGIWNAFNCKYSTGDKERGVRTGNGTIAFTPTPLSNIGTLPTPETITLLATNATNFTCTGTVSTGLAAVTVGVSATRGPWKFLLTAGGTPFIAGDTFVFDGVVRMGVVGQSREANITSPNAEVVLQHLNNECGCQGQRSAMTTGIVNDELGTVGNLTASESKLGVGGVSPLSGATDYNSQAYFDVFEGLNAWKPFDEWYFNQVIKPHYKNWTLCGVGPGNIAHGNDDRGTEGIRGVVHIAKFGGNTIAMRTLDNEGHFGQGSLMTSYGGGARVTGSVLIPAPSGNLFGRTSFSALYPPGNVSKLTEYYNYAIWAVEPNAAALSILGTLPGTMGFFNPPHFLLASDFGVSTATYDYSLQTIQRSKGNAGARKLPADGGMFGLTGGAWWVYNHPFHTYGTSGGVAATGTGDWASIAGTILASTYEYYHLRVTGVTYSGTSPSVSDDFVYRYFAINYTHLQTDNTTPVSGGTWNTPAGIGNTGGSDTNYPNMRSAAVRKGEAYDISWSRTDMPNRPQALSMEVIGFWSTDSNVLFSVDWDGATAVSTIGTAGRTFTARSSKADIVANRNSNGYWVDTTNNKLWINVYGNAGVPYPSDPDYGLTNTVALGAAWTTLKVNR